MEGLPARDHHLASITRITDFATREIVAEPVPRSQWATGDYVVGEVLEMSAFPLQIEAPDGRMVEVLAGDTIVGALGRRAATLEVVGDWRDVGDDLELDVLTMAGVLGNCTSAATPRPTIIRLRYRGHVLIDGAPRAMRDYVLAAPERELTAPVVLVIGTSMEAGKTTAAKRIIRRLTRLGLRVGGTKLTGVGRYRDILGMRDAGADPVLDFVDAGLPSTVVAEAEFEPAARLLLSRFAEAGPDVLVAEAGASPLEPYNGDAAMRLLEAHVRCVVLCAPDPYAVLGVMRAFQITPDLVAGRATSTAAGIALVERLCGVPALNVLNPASQDALEAILRERLGISATAAARPLP